MGNNAWHDDKKNKNYAKVKDSIQKFKKRGKEVTFRGISKHCDISTTTLYERKELREMIEKAKPARDKKHVENKDADANLRFENDLLKQENKELKEENVTKHKIIEEQNGQIYMADIKQKELIALLKVNNIPIPKQNDNNQ